MSAAVGTAVFASFDKVAGGTAKVVLGLVSILAAVLASLQTFLSFAERANRHRITGSKYGAVRRALEYVKTFPPSGPEEVRRELEKIKQEMDGLAENAPHVPSRIKRKVDDQLKTRTHQRVFHLPGLNETAQSPRVEARSDADRANLT